VLGQSRSLLPPKIGTCGWRGASGKTPGENREDMKDKHRGFVKKRWGKRTGKEVSK